MRWKVSLGMYLKEESRALCTRRFRNFLQLKRGSSKLEEIAVSHHILHENMFLETLSISFTLKAVNINPQRKWKILLQSRCRPVYLDGYRIISNEPFSRFRPSHITAVNINMMNDFRMKLDLFIFCNTICKPASDDRACEGEREVARSKRETFAEANVDVIVNIII